VFKPDRDSSKPAGKRDNFSKLQRDAAFEYNVREVDALRRNRYDWREALGAPSSGGGAAKVYYICEHCRFVSDRKDDFEVDHLVSCMEGGNANREKLETLSWLQREVDQPLDKQDLGRLMLLNLNSQVLCHGCNQGKKSKGMRPDEIPAGCGYAYRKPEEDRNPDHRDGLPPLSDYVHPRYRRG
jgi:hypothetical protein